MMEHRAIRRLFGRRGRVGLLGDWRVRRALMVLGIIGALLVAALADHVRATSAAYQVAAAQHGVALRITLQAKQATRRILHGLAVGLAGEPTQSVAALWPALMEHLAELEALPARAGATGLAALHQALPAMVDAARAIGHAPDAPAERILPLLAKVDEPLQEAAAAIERDGRTLARGFMLQLAGELLFFAMGFLLLVASSAVLVGLLVLAWRRAGAAVNQARAAEREARAAHKGLDALLESVPALIATFDLDLRVLQANRPVREMFGLGRNQAADAAQLQRRAQLERDLRQVRDSGQPILTVEHDVQDIAGRRRHLVTSTVPLFDAEGRLHRILRTSLDVTQRREAEQRVQHLAEHDALTDLPNRLRFKAELEAALAAGRPLALHVLDMDGFRQVNDAHGQAVGDALLLAVARRLGGLIRRGDTLARLGGDEFAVLQSVRSPAEASSMASRIIQALAQPYQLGPSLVRCSASLGVAVLIEGEASAEAMLSRADLALASARREGIGRSMTFSTEMEGEALERRRLQGELALALARGQLHLDYQPKFAMAGGAMEGVEALLRWDHPSRGPVSPAEFVPLAEEAGLALPLARFVLDRAATQIKAWLAQGQRIPVAVNLSGELIGTDETLNLVRDVLAESAVPPELLEIEVTESTFIGDSAAARAMLSGLRGLGIRVALDDFGTGFSSLAYLQDLPIDVLKVDRSFVAGLTRGDGGASGRIVDTVVRLAHGLGARVVAEGVETAEQLETLRRLGCDAVQGYFLARPQRAETIPSLLTRTMAQERLAIPA